MTFYFPFLMLAVSLPAGGAVQGQWDNLQSLRKGQGIQVVQMDLKSFGGNFLEVSDEAIRMRIKKEERRIPRSEVFRVSVRIPSRRARNALIGLAVGGGLGAGVGAALFYRTGGIDFAQAIIGGTTVIGAGIGAGTGAAFPGYATLYRAPKPVHRTP
jgi:hypothetical protein